MPKRSDLVGKKFGRLLVLEFKYVSCGHSQWLCQCDCGNTVIVANGNLQSGNTTSCGCFQREIISLPEGEAMFNTIFRRYKQNAKSRNISFSLDKELFRKLISLDCFYCGTPPSTVGTRNKTNGDYIYNGVDRLDSSKGYTADNVVPCCPDCNYAKNNIPYSKFKEWIFRVSDHMLSKEISYSRT